MVIHAILLLLALIFHNSGVLAASRLAFSLASWKQPAPAGYTKHALHGPARPSSLQLSALHRRVSNRHGPQCRQGCVRVTGKADSCPPAEEKEMDRVWAEIQKSCTGCWSGSYSTYVVQGGQLVFQEGSRELNLRFEIRTPDDTPGEGTWRFWNLGEEGRQSVSPITQRYAMTAQCKVAFEGVIIRVPRVWKSGEGVTFEIGFWDREEGMRRTCVVQYAVEQGTLQAITVMQCREEPEEGFVGNTTDRDGIAVLPLDCVWDLRGMLPLQVGEASCEVVEMPSMERKLVSGSLGSSEARRVLSTFSDGSSELLTQVLPNGVAFAAPRARKPGTASSLYFAHQVVGGRLRVLELSYDGATAAASRFALHSVLPA